MTEPQEIVKDVSSCSQKTQPSKNTRRNNRIKGPVQNKVLYMKMNNLRLTPKTTNPNVVQLNVGGHVFQTTLTTLARLEDSMLGRMFSSDWLSSESKEVFIDRDGRHFHVILNYLRDGHKVVLPNDQIVLKELIVESEYYQLDGFAQLINDKLHLPSRPIRVQEIVRWKPQAIPLYWKAFAQSLNQDGVEFLFSYDRVGKKYNDKQTIATCIGCMARFSVDQITVFDYKIDTEMWAGVEQTMHELRGVVVETVGAENQTTCSIVQWANTKRLHVPNTAIMPDQP